LVQNASDECEAEEMDAEDPFFVLYSSGSTGRFKGHTAQRGAAICSAQGDFTMWTLEEGDDDVFCARSI